MSRVLVMGYELPDMANGAIEARSYRTWQFVQPLLENGSEVCLLVSHNNNEANVPHIYGPLLRYHRINLMKRGWLGHANQICSQFKPDATLGVMFNNGLRATRLALKRPLWIDLYGDRVSEMQVSSHTSQSARGVQIMHTYLKAILRGADVYSTCSTPQKYALVGQLGMALRINRHTMGYEFVHPILPGAPSRNEKIHPVLSVRGHQVPEDAFIVLWCGGYNVWTDIDTLFQALNQAMDANPRVHYVSAGAGVRLTNNDSYERFLDMVAASPHRDRFHLLGWQPSSAIPSLYQQADVGVNLDAFHYETQLGTRTRLVEMMHHSLPVLTTLGCELSYIVENHRLGLTFPIGDADMFARHILTLASNDELRQKYASQAGEYTNQELSFQETTRPFLEWANAPYYAPDRVRKRTKFDIHELEYTLRAGMRSLLWKVWALERGD